MVALNPDELSVLCQVRMYGPLSLEKLYQVSFADSHEGLRDIVKNALDNLVNSGLVDLSKGIYKIHNFSE